MSAIDLDDYVAWLHARGVADEHLPLYREGAELVLAQTAGDEVSDAHVEAVVRTEAAHGASARRQDNLRAIGARLRVYLDERRAEAAAASGAFEAPRDDEPALELADVPRGTSRRARLARISGTHAAEDGSSVRGTMVDDLPAPAEAAPDPSTVQAAMAPRSALSPSTVPPISRPMPVAAVPFTDGPRPGVLASPSRTARLSREERPLPGCACRTRHEVFADDYWSMWGKVYLFVTATLGFFLSMFWSRLASLSVGLGIAAVGALASAATAGWRCTDCRRWIERRGLDAEQVRNQRTRQLVFLGMAAALAIACVLVVHRVRAQLAEERRALKVLDDVREFDDGGS
ncbi:MAG TPA: hypothetical protein VHE35_31105 [Kofleriaceae bacterium]|nr:hypothetical protein [Kofleriaceae bacterium]